VQGFDDRTPAVFLEAERSPGFIARARAPEHSNASNFEVDWGPWGTFSVPRFYTLGRATGTDQRASTLSTWTDLRSVFRFVYAGLHREALKRRTEWFLEPRWPTYAIWWIGDQHVPTWSEACEKLELLHDRGPTPDAFDFRCCFDQHGVPLDREALRGQDVTVASVLESRG
jgi:hypothetical protein